MFCADVTQETDKKRTTNYEQNFYNSLAVIQLVMSGERIAVYKSKYTKPTVKHKGGSIVVYVGCSVNPTVADDG